MSLIDQGGLYVAASRGYRGGSPTAVQA